MKIRLPLLVCLLLAFLMTASYLLADVQNNSLVSRRANIVEDKRFEKRMWVPSKSNSLMDKRFPIEKWNKHFSSLGNKRAPITIEEASEKTVFRTKTLERKKVDFDMSGWNQRMAKLHKNAGIEMDDQAQLVADRQLYNKMLPGNRKFRDLGDEVSLRDLNRYQFRRNRPDGEIPVDSAGSGQ